MAKKSAASKRSQIVKQARAGKDIRKPGKTFAKIEKSAAKKYGSKEAGKKVAAAVMWKLTTGRPMKKRGKGKK